MSETARDAKLLQYLNEAYAKERELEAALQAHIGMTTRKPYVKRLREHLSETKDHARQVERRIKQLSGEGPGRVQSVAGQAMGQAKSLAKGPLHMLRGTGEAEKMLKNAKTEYFSEHEEIATYSAIEALAESVGDTDTARMARSIRRDEERMAQFLSRQIPQLVKAVVREEVPAAERRTNRSRRRRRPSANRSRSSSGTRASSRSRSSGRSRASSRNRSGSRRAGTRRTRTTAS
jgi:ferritin-like metal-binding protein YciE